MSVYSELWDLLHTETAAPTAVFGTICSVSPLTVEVQEEQISQGLFIPRNLSFNAWDVGREVALLPCDEGFILLFEIEEANR